MRKQAYISPEHCNPATVATFVNASCSFFLYLESQFNRQHLCVHRMSTRERNQYPQTSEIAKPTELLRVEALKVFMRNTIRWGYQTSSNGLTPLRKLGHASEQRNTRKRGRSVLMVARRRRRALTMHISRNCIGDAAGFNQRAGWARRNGFEVRRNIGPA